MASGPFLHVGAWRTAVTADDSTQKEELGALRFENGRVYKYVRATAASIAANRAVAYLGDDGTTVQSAPASATTIAGVAETALSTSNYGWIVVSGKASTYLTTAVTAGHTAVMSATAGVFVAPTSATLGARGQITAATTGLSTTAATTVSAVLVHCL